jgi:hypothetical protein
VTAYPSTAFAWRTGVGEGAAVVEATVDVGLAAPTALDVGLAEGGLDAHAARIPVTSAANSVRIVSLRL